MTQVMVLPSHPLHHSITNSKKHEPKTTTRKVINHIQVLKFIKSDIVLPYPSDIMVMHVMHIVTQLEGHFRLMSHLATQNTATMLLNMNSPDVNSGIWFLRTLRKATFPYLIVTFGDVILGGYIIELPGPRSLSFSPISFSSIASRIFGNLYRKENYL